MSMSIEIFACLSDNYGYLLHDHATGATAAVDAADDRAIMEALARRGWALSDIIVTHHHWDHTDAIAPLKQAFDVTVSGPAREEAKIAGLDNPVQGGDTLMIGSLKLEVIDTPGHTLGHVAYFERQSSSLFCGDALFSLGCGRIFEGTPEQMWTGLKNLRELPDQTLAYCGHEYSAANAAFALSVDPDNEALKARAAEIAALRAKDRPTIPFLLGEDKLANPFLRADAPELAAVMGMPGADPARVFAAIRKAKDGF